ncbi:MAG: response regulator [Candidatus Micrarchaeota archaeon]
MKKVLIVDDEPDNVALFKLALEGAGVQVDTAGSGAEALEKLKKSVPDVMVLDFFMPKMSGRQVCEEMAKEKKYKKVKIILFTVAKISEAGISELKKLGVIEYLQKPVTMEELCNTVKNVLGG